MVAISALRRPARAILLAGLLVAATALPAVVAADTGGLQIEPAASRGATIQVAPPIAVTGRVVASVQVMFICDPFELYDWETGTTVTSTQGSLEGGAVVLVQASGKTVNSGSGFYGAAPVVCDGATVNTRTAAVTATAAPWKSGTAVVGASVYIASLDGQDSAYASSGPITVKLSK